MSETSSKSSADYVLLTRLADEFAARYRAGQRPALQEYIDRYPELADNIRELFPAMVEIEEVKEDHQEAGEPAAGPPAAALQQLGDFRIQREIGRGGMGIVYEAEQVSLGRHVALKVLPKNLLLDARAKRRFEREAKAAAKLHHTNIVPVFGVGEQDGMPYYVMQFIQGLGLDDVLEELKRMQVPGNATASVTAGEKPVSRQDASAVDMARSLIAGQFQSSENEEFLQQVDSFVQPFEKAWQSSVRPAIDDFLPKDGPDRLRQAVLIELVQVDLERRLGAGEPAQAKDYLEHYPELAPCFHPTQADEAPQKESVEAGKASRRKGGRPADSFTLSSSSAILPGQSDVTRKSKRKKETYWQSVAQIGVQVADALEYAHKQGILHRDIKPSNLLLDTRGTVWVTDFGLAKADDQQNITHTGDILGTLRYMAPEAFEGKTDTRSDAYSLGLTLYEFIALRPAFDEKVRNRLIKQVTSAAPVRLSKLNAAVPRDLETIVHKATDREPARRYQTAADLTADLQRFIDDEPIKARPQSSVERLVRWCRRNPMIASLAAAVMLVTVVGFGATLWQMRIADEVAAAAEADLYVARMNLAQTDWENAHVGRIREVLDPYRHMPAGKYDPRGWEWYYQDRLCQLDLRTLEGHTGWVESVAFSPDGSLLASGSIDTTIKIWNPANNGQCLRTLEGHKDGVLSVTFSRDGKSLASGSVDGDIRLWDVVSGQKLHAIKGAHKGAVRSVAFGPDGLLASGGEDEMVKVWDVANGKVLHARGGGSVLMAFSQDGSRLAWGGDELTLWDIGGGEEPRALKGHARRQIGSVAFSPDGNRLASASPEGEITFWDATSGQEMRTLKAHTGGVFSLAFSPDGKRLVSGSHDQTIKIWDADNGRELRTLKGHSAGAKSVAFSPDGSRLASGSYDQTIKIWDAHGGQEPRPLKHISPVWSMAFSADGSRLASASSDRTVKIWDTATGLALHSLKHADEVLSVAFSPDGRWLASGSDDNTISIWDVASGKRRDILTGHNTGVRSVAFSRDGKWLASGSFDGEIKLWNAAGQLLRTFNHEGRDLSVAFSPDDQWLASASSDATIKIWDLASGQLQRELKGHGGRFNAPASVAFSPDSIRLASGNYDRIIKVWDVKSGQQLHTFKGHTGWITSVAFSPDGRRLVSAGYDWTVKIWDAESGKELRTLKGHNGPVESVVFSQDGQRLASGGRDHTIQLWDARPWTPELRRQREAFGLVDYLCQRFLSKEKVLERIRADKGIPEVVRSDALKLSDEYWPRHARQQLADCLSSKQWDLALRYAEELLAVSTKDGNLYAVRAEIEQEQGRVAEAASDVAQAMKLEADPASISRATRLVAVAKGQGVVQDWLILGPLPLKKGQTDAEAVDDDLVPGEANLNPKTVVKDSNGNQLLWQKLHKSHLRDGYVIDFKEAFKGMETDYSVAYAVCYLIVAKDVHNLRMLIGSDDQAKIYLNGKGIYKYDGRRPLTQDDDTKDVTLTKGTYPLVFKVVNGVLDWKGCIRFVEQNGLPANGIRVSLTP